jgi:hypothetical protein
MQRLPCHRLLSKHRHGSESAVPFFVEFEGNKVSGPQALLGFAASSLLTFSTLHVGCVWVRGCVGCLGCSLTLRLACGSVRLSRFLRAEVPLCYVMSVQLVRCGLHCCNAGLTLTLFGILASGKAGTRLWYQMLDCIVLWE